MNKSKIVLLAASLILAMTFTLSSCVFIGDDDDSKEEQTPSSSSVVDDDGINWNNETSGTIEVANLTTEAVVLFQGELPIGSNILGGIEASSTKFIDVEDDVSDFGVGGYMIMRGMSKKEYEANKADLKKAKIEYSAMIVYGQGKKFKFDLRPDYIGDYGFTVTNKAKVGVELRKNSPNGEKIAFIPKLSVNNLVYSQTSNEMGLYPVYTWYNKSTKTISTAEVDDILDAVFVSPRLLTENIPNRIFGGIDIDFKSPVAYVNVTNNISNVSTKFTIAGATQTAQNGYDAVESGEQLTFEIPSTEDGTSKNLVMSFKGGVVEIPIYVEGESEAPVLKNGYNYVVTVSGLESTLEEAKAVIRETGKRDMNSEIESL